MFADEHRVLPVSVKLNGEYGQRDVYASVPAVISAEGIEDILELDLTDDELEKFAASCKTMRDNYCKALSL